MHTHRLLEKLINIFPCPTYESTATIEGEVCGPQFHVECLYAGHLVLTAPGTSPAATTSITPLEELAHNKNNKQFNIYTSILNV